MEKEIKNILRDLYKLDRNLKKYEPELVKIIQELIITKPQVIFNEKFKEKLKAELLLRIQEIKADQPQKITSFPLMAKFSYGLAGALIVVVLAIPIIYLNQNLTNLNDFSELFGPSSDSSLKQLNNNAFGRLIGTQDQATSGKFSARLQSGGGGGLATAEVGFGGGGSAGSAMIVAPVSYNYKFSYVGGDFKINDSKMDVYKRYTTDNIQTKLAKIIKGMNLGFINISSLDNAKVQNLSIIEDKEGGYSVSLGLNDESASINIYYNKPYITNEQKILSEADIPGDDKIIKTANELLQKFGLNVKNYGQPVVDKSWKIYYEQNQGEDIARYIPYVMQVTYPIIINNMELYDESGNYSGPQVGVNIASNKAESVWGIGSNNYQTSKYDVEQDAEKIIKVALKGGYRRYYDLQSNNNIINIELGTPKISLAMIGNFKDGAYEQLFVPALIFPVVNDVDRNKFYQKNIVVPLVKDLLDQDVNPEPMPLPVDLIK